MGKRAVTVHLICAGHHYTLERMGNYTTINWLSDMGWDTYSQNIALWNEFLFALKKIFI